MFEIPIEVSKKLDVLYIFHRIAHCDHYICFVMEQGCHNRFVVSRTKKGEKVVENFKRKQKFFFLKSNIAKWQKFTIKITLIKPSMYNVLLINSLNIP